MYIHTFTYVCYRYVVEIVHDDYTVLMAKWHGEASLQLMAAYLLSTMVGIPFL